MLTLGLVIDDLQPEIPFSNPLNLTNDESKLSDTRYFKIPSDYENAMQIHF